MQARTADLRGLEVRTLNSIALAIVNGVAPFAPQARRWRTIDEPEVRALLGRFVQTRRQLNVDPLAPWLDALSAMRLGLLAPDEVAAGYGGDVDGLGEVWPQLRRGDGAHRRRRLRRPDQARDRRAADATRGAPRRAAGVPAVAGRRVPGPDARAHAARAPARRRWRRGVRRGRRRPDDLRLQRRRSQLADRLRELVPRLRRPSARGQLPLPGGRGRGRRPAAAPQPAARQQGDPSRGAAIGRSRLVGRRP